MVDGIVLPSDVDELLKLCKIYNVSESYDAQFRKILEFYYNAYKKIPYQLVRKDDVKDMLYMISKLKGNFKVVITPVTSDEINSLFSKVVNSCFGGVTLGDLVLTIFTTCDCSQVDVRTISNLFIKLYGSKSLFGVMSKNRRHSDVITLLDLVYEEYVKRRTAFCRGIKNCLKPQLSSILVKNKYNKVCGSTKASKSSNKKKVQKEKSAKGKKLKSSKLKKKSKKFRAKSSK